MPNAIKITWIKSDICTKQNHRATIKALGLKRLRHSVVKKDSPQIRGMIRAIDFLVRVEEVKS